MGQSEGNIGGISEKKLLEIWTILVHTRLHDSRDSRVANYAILTGRTDNLAFVWRETGCGTIIELFKANA